MSLSRENNLGKVKLGTFLASLYKNLNPNFYCELRCIDPSDRNVRSYWFRHGHSWERQRAMKQAYLLNKLGYGVYYTPCLHRSRSRRLEDIVGVSALWVDIDFKSNAHSREQCLNFLFDFEITPSAIVDTGGGYHVYFFLSEFIPHEDWSVGFKISLYLRGLSQALKGDDAYAKSIASVMRLPASKNTKPDRLMPTSIAYFAPENRYDLERFDWLKLEEKSLKSELSLNDVDRDARALPERTRHYLENGAGIGQRNFELFAAACQCRDFGMSIAETETLLVSRHLQDSLAGESIPARKVEAKQTISSAFSRSHRPIARKR